MPFVYTPLYEGGESTPGVFAIGEVTSNQLAPAIRWLGVHRRPKRWLAVGNDYVWPHVSHRQARRYIADAGADMVAETRAAGKDEVVWLGVTSDSVRTTYGTRITQESEPEPARCAERTLCA